MPEKPLTVVVPTPFPVGPVNCWLLPGEPLTLIDSGPNTAEALDVLERGLEHAGVPLSAIELLIVTHQHSDHAGLATVVQRRSGCRVAAHASIVDYLAQVESATLLEEEYADALMRLHGEPAERREAYLAVARGRRGFVAPVDVDLPLAEGDVIEAGGRRLTVSLRPGHSPSDTVFVDPDAGCAFVGDHLLAHISSNPVVHRPLTGSADPRRRGSALASYLDSLARTGGEDLQVLYTGHGDTIDDHRPLVAERRRLHGERVEQVHGELGEGARSAAAISQTMWPDIPASQTYLALCEVLGALDLLEAQGRVVAEDDGDRLAYRRL